MTRLVKTLGALVFLLCPLGLRAQSSFLVPVTNTSGVAIPGATVTLTCLSGACGTSIYTTTTDSAGNAQFSNVTVGRYTVSIVGVGITPYSYTYDVSSPNPSSLNSIIYVDGVRNTTIQAAYNAAVAKGVYRVFIPDGTYSIALGSFTMSQPVMFECESRKGTVINFTGASGIGVLVNYATTPTGDYRDWGAGFYNCTLFGPGGFFGSGNAGTLFQVGDSSHASIGFQLNNDLISGFALGLTWGNAGAWGLSCRDSNFINDSQLVLYNLNSTTGMENAAFDHCTFGADTFSDGMLSNAIQLGIGTSPFDGNFVNTSFDGAQLVNDNGTVKTVNAHHENPGGNTTLPYTVNGGTGFISEVNPDYYQDSSSGSVPSYFVQQTAGVYPFFSPYFHTNAAMSHAVDNSGGGNMFLAGVRNAFGTYSGGAYNLTGDFGNVFDHLGNINFGGPAAIFNAPLTVQGGSSKVTTTGVVGAFATKSSAYPLTAQDYWVNVTGTTTITVPHALTGQHWVIFNSGSNTVTIAADSGNVNGSASITISANVGKECTADGTNVFCH